ncbi:unnamed protein product [Macrosiphum euphorbiae]|uniref:Uncharacterized protein n=1 Tax=Macrosiphum euphorbiae TaxID=13131 RepID=A0AAV0VVB8_9HEMI|nr:unnamed protein product [Macrosiphum euphorbiae]
MKTALATCVPESDVLLLPDANEEIKYLRACVVKNFVDIDKEMRLDLLRVSLLLHLSARRIKNRVKTCETENVQNAERKKRNLSTVGDLLSECSRRLNKTLTI